LLTTTARGKGEEKLTVRGTVHRNTTPRLEIHAERPRGFHPVEIDDLSARQNAEVHRLCKLFGQALEEELDVTVRGGGPDRLEAQVNQGGSHNISACQRFFVHKSCVLQ